MRRFSGGRIRVIFWFAVVVLCKAQSTQQSPLRGSISGRLLDESGQPLSRWHVAAGQWQYHLAHRVFSMSLGGQTATKADGSFVLENLVPGEYALRADPASQGRFVIPRRPAPAPEPPTPSPTERTNIRTYFPGVLNAAFASSIRVEAGTRTTGIEFRAQRGRLFHVSARVNLSGDWGSGYITIKPLDSPVPEDRNMVFADAGGNFLVNGLSAGSYVLKSGLNGKKAFWLIVTLKDHDVDDLVVDATPCAQVKGTITLDGKPVDNSSSNYQVSLSVLDAAMSLFGRNGSNGDFSVPCIETVQASLPAE